MNWFIIWSTIDLLSFLGIMIILFLILTGKVEIRVVSPIKYRRFK